MEKQIDCYKMGQNTARSLWDSKNFPGMTPFGPSKGGENFNLGKEEGVEGKGSGREVLVATFYCCIASTVKSLPAFSADSFVWFCGIVWII